MTDDELKWRNRLWAYSAARIGGLAVFGLGLAIFYTDLLRDGGWPQVGAVVIVLGLIDALFAPMILKRHWDREDGNRR
jgi:hypothetical protein